MHKGGIGASIRRKEDARLISGHGEYGEDCDGHGALTAVFLRSPLAHAKIREIDCASARKKPGVVAVLTAADARQDGLQPIPHATGGSHIGSDVPLRQYDGSERLTTPHLPLAQDKSLYVGQAIAIVVARDINAAKDGAESIRIEFDELPSATRACDALSSEAMPIWPNIPSNLALDAEVGDADETAAAFASAPHRVSLRAWVQRVTGVHMEPRTVEASWDDITRKLTVRASHGAGVQQLRHDLAHVLRLEPDCVRVVAPRDVGGNFGARNATYPEMAAVAWAAMRIKGAVRYVAERQEAFLSDFQGRDLEISAELALDNSGSFVALRTTNVSNLGAHTVSFVPLNKGVQLMSGSYRIPVAHYRAKAALTNTPSTIPYRSAGRPEAIYAIERLIDVASRDLGFDRVEIRRKNLVRPDEMPYRNPAGVSYDNGDYREAMDRALQLADWDGFPVRRDESRKKGRFRGISISNYVETASGNPNERAEVVVLPNGSVELVIGTQSTGQGHETSFSQIICDWLGVPFDRVEVRTGDTDFVRAGGGSHSGRSIRFGSLVMRKACDALIEKGRRIAAYALEAADDDVEFVDGRFGIRGADRSRHIFELARFAERSDLPEDLRGPLSGACQQTVPGHAFPYGSCVCEVEIEPETGLVSIVGYVSIDDVGRAVNPLILHGQTHGGIAQGLGQALMEQCCYDRASGQALSGSLMDYAMPRADDFPFFVTELSETPAASHPLGFRPGGEGGTTPALAAAINAILDALHPIGVRELDMPATPARIWRAIREARERQTGPRCD